VDASSKNGTWAGGERIRTRRLAPGTRLALAGKATVEWRAFH
jgi:pSer/pThr/pTyr-binding forkhead associated (FHA) protein